MLGEGDSSYRFGELDFSHEEVKRVVAFVYRFFFFFLSIASTA